MQPARPCSRGRQSTISNPQDQGKAEMVLIQTAINSPLVVQPRAEYLKPALAVVPTKHLSDVVPATSPALSMPAKDMATK